VARPSVSSLPVPEQWVARPCAFCKGGYDAACTILLVMPSGLHRTYGAHHLHFITCSCYRRLPFLSNARSRDTFLNILEQTRQRYCFVVVGYVVMPEHIHLLGGWPSLSVADAMIKRVPHSSRTLRRVGTMQLAVPFFDFPENLIIQAARTRPCKKRKDGAPFSYFVPKILKAGPPALKTLNPSTALRDHHHVTPDRSGSAAKGKTRACPLL
jgi:REP element-mobilizing transposase RayT